MEKKKCSLCGKTWIAEKFDGHLCPAPPPKPRKVRASVPPVKTATTTPDDTVKGPPLISFRRMS